MAPPWYSWISEDFRRIAALRCLGSPRVGSLPRGQNPVSVKSRSLLNSFAQICEGTPPTFALVFEYSGVEKTSIVREVHRSITSRKGFFVSYAWLMVDAIPELSTILGPTASKV